MPATSLPGATGPVFGSRTTRWRRRAVGWLASRVLRAIDASLCPPGALPASGIHRILVCRPNHRLGNTVLLSPLLREIETRYPGAEIDILCTGPAAGVLFGPRFMVRAIIDLPCHMARHPWVGLARLRQVRRNRYDLAIDACPASYSGRLALGLSHARWKLGFPLSEPGPLRGYLEDCPIHVAKRSVHLLRVACADRGETGWPVLGVELESTELARGLQALAAVAGRPGETAGPVLGVFPNATGAKCYPAAWWTDFIAALHVRRPDIRIVNVLAEHGRSQLPGAQAAFYSRNLRKLAAVLAGMDGFVSADCGVMHLASAVGTPTLGLFMLPTREKYEPYGPRNRGLNASLERGGAAAAGAVADWLDRACPCRTAEIATA